MRWRTHPRASMVFFLVWALFTIKSFLYIAITPIWEGFDEPFHFGYIHSLANSKTLPGWGDAYIDMSIARTTALVPIPELLPRLDGKTEKLSHYEYWRLSTEEQSRLESQLQRITAHSRDANPSRVQNYQIQHPPLYYLLCVPIYQVLNSVNLLGKVFAIRLFSALLASLSIVAGYQLAKEIDLRPRAMFALLLAAWPCLFLDIARVGNDSLGIALFSFIFLYMVRYGKDPSRKTALQLGIVTGLGLITKASFLTVIPAIFLFLTMLVLRNRTLFRRIIGDAMLVAVCLTALGGWWYVRNHLLYGSFSGLQESVRYPSIGFSERLQAVLEIPWGPILKNFVATFCWVNGWSFLRLPRVLYLVFAAVLAVVAAGWMRNVNIFGTRKVRDGSANVSIMAALCMLAFFVAGLAYHQVNAYATVKTLGGPGGWYLYVLIVPICFLASKAISGWHKYESWTFLGIFLALTTVELYAIVFVLVPYYTGMAFPDAGGWGVEFSGNPMLSLSGETLNRLLANKPNALSFFVLAALIFAYFLAQAAAFCIVIRETLTGQPSGETSQAELF